MDTTTQTSEQQQPVTGTQTTEAPQAGAPLTSEQALKRIAELERDREETRAQRRELRITQLANELASRFAEAMAYHLVDPIADKIRELEKSAPAEIDFEQVLADIKVCRSAEDFACLCDENDFPVDLVLEQIEESAKEELARTAEQIALDEKAAKEIAA